MNQDQKLRQLLQLKRHESPGEAYFEAFLPEFHRYQALQPLQPASQASWFEAFSGWVDNLVQGLVARPAAVLAPYGAACAVLAAACVVVFSGLSHSPTSVAETTVGGGYSQGFVTAPAAPARLIAQPEEFDLASVSSFDKDFGSARYVTGQAVGEYDSALAF
ncbi:MAG: hypothetical protein SFU85_08235 [Candidatus Methylacidiphilales bacterium]|nr:hypothetical protein [Candidatus Methylacidiphilales bacterium]